MSLFIRDVSTVPQEGWAYPGVNGYMVNTRNYGIFYDEIVKHYTANGQPPPSREEVIAYVCEHSSVPCYEGAVPFVNRWTLELPVPGPKGCC